MQHYFCQFGTTNGKYLDEYNMLFPDKSEDYLKLMTLIDKIWLIDSGIVVSCYPLFEKNLIWFFLLKYHLGN